MKASINVVKMLDKLDKMKINKESSWPGIYWTDDPV
jgi:hypothetical protein